ncbi:galactokinase [Oleiharenicola lentus]|uniref:galactokinase n=1 Tax=Oleiharenicola lentus TaxID=2508720 RepID=UPI003F6799DF
MNPTETASLIQEFKQTYGHAPVVIARAPGRVEFIGNHTDYNGGAVLGAAIDRYVWVAASPNPQGRLRLFSANGPAVLELPADPGTKVTGSDAWANYPLGVWRSLKDFGLPRPEGFDLFVSSNLPAGAGLSSSAALELAVALALLAVAGQDGLAPDQLAKLGRHAENHYVGVPCGILDQGTSAHGKLGHLVHIDCRGPVFSVVPFPSSAHLWIFNTREKHALIDGMYATRNRECLDAAKTLGVALLADLTPAQLAPLESKLAPEVAQRAKHIVGEHARVHETASALEKGDLSAVGKLLTASHRSSQHLFENSTRALDDLVDLLEKHPKVYGARLTGGGFGGAVMALTQDDFSEKDAAEISQNYSAHHGGAPEVIHLQSADGAQIIWRG